MSCEGEKDACALLSYSVQQPLVWDAFVSLKGSAATHCTLPTLVCVVPADSAAFILKGRGWVSLWE